ncbi:MAG: multiheme c-type cytochrome [Thioalkalispiraceae bacterium]
MNTIRYVRLKQLILAGLCFSVSLLTACGGGDGAPPADSSEPLPVEINDTSFTSTHFSGSAVCADCHNGLIDASANDVSIEADWSTSLMAHSAKDPFYRAKVASEIRRNPQLKDVLDDKCSRCHMPMANVEAKFEGSTVELLGDGFLNPQNAYYNHAMDGVSCTACHQIEDDGNLGTLAGFSGEFRIVDLGTSAERTAFGQYTEPAINPMLFSTNFRPTYAPHISSSAMCATCHNLKTPYVDATGTVISTTPETEFPEQMVYTEWENSSFASGATLQSCQDCHMPRTDGVRIANRPPSLNPRDNFARHTLVGANTMMLDLLASNQTELGVIASGFTTAIAQTRSLLESAADIEVLSESLVNNELIVQIRINNNSGHKLPTSYPSRRAYIYFVVRDDAGNILFESGRTNPDGSIVGVDADTNLAFYETHYEEISQQDQVQVYEPIMINTDNDVTYTLLRAAGYIKDNRILPLGFDKNTTNNDIRVQGAAMADPDFIAGSDTITYRVDVGLVRPVNYSVELKYQPLAYAFVMDLFRDNSDPEVAKFETLFDSAAIRSETIDSVSGSQP